MTFLVGASGTGKTTMVQCLAKRLDMPVIASSTMEVAEKFGGLDKIPDESAFQLAVANAAFAKVREAVASGQKSFLCDRLIDHMAYTAVKVKVVKQIWDSPEFEEACDFMRRGLVFFVRPHPAVLAAARAADGGRRSQYLTDEFVYRIDGIINFLLQVKGIHYFDVVAPDLEKRLEPIQDLILAQNRCAQLLRDYKIDNR